MSTSTRYLVRIVLLTAVSLSYQVAHGQSNGMEETLTRHSFVPYPESADDLLRAEVAQLGPALALEVMTSVAEPLESNLFWKHLKGIVRRMHNQNEILHVIPQFYINSGRSMACRYYDKIRDSDQEVEVYPSPKPLHCELSCTNYGRYCVVPNDNDPLSEMNVRGKMLVEETLRRSCFVEIYKGSDLRFWYVHTICRNSHQTPDGIQYWLPWASD
jgi:hypothetical protein